MQMPQQQVEQNLVQVFFSIENKYTKKYNYAWMILDGKQELQDEIKEAKDKIERKYGMKLGMLEIFYNSTLDLYTDLKHGGRKSRKKTSMLTVKMDLADFSAKLEDVVRDNYKGFI